MSTIAPSNEQLLAEIREANLAYLVLAQHMSAVSNKLIPSSTARRTIGLAAASSSTHGRHWGEP